MIKVLAAMVCVSIAFNIMLVVIFWQWNVYAGACAAAILACMLWQTVRGVRKLF
jgi:hypothetical protein